MELSLIGAIVCALILVWFIFVEIPCIAATDETVGMVLYRYLTKQKEQTTVEVIDNQPQKEKHILDENTLVEMTDIYPGTVCYITHFSNNPSYDFETDRYTLKSVDGYYHDHKQGLVDRPNNWVTASRKRFRVLGNIHNNSKVIIQSVVKGTSAKLYNGATGRVIGYNTKKNLYVVRLQLPFYRPDKGTMETKLKNFKVLISEQNLVVIS